MSPVLPVLATARRDGFRLRAYAAAARRPALPVISAGDLARAVMPTRDDEVELLVAFRRGALAGDVHTALTEDGPTLVIAHGAAFVLATLFGRMAVAPERAGLAEALLEEAVTDGVVAMTDRLEIPRCRAWIWRAWRRDKARVAALMRSAQADMGVEHRPEARHR